MNKKKKSRAALRALAMLALLAIMSGCAQNAPDERTADEISSEIDVSDTQPIVTEDPAAKDLTVVDSGRAVFRVIRPDEAANGDQCVKSALEIKNALQKYVTDGSVEITSDFGKNTDAASFDVLVGNVDFEAAKTVADQIGYNEYAVWASGHKIVIIGHSDENLEKAAKLFCELLESHRLENADGSCTVKIPVEELNTRRVTGTELSGFPVFDGASLDYIEKDARKNLFAYIKNVSAASYKDYKTKLTDRGFTCFLDENKSGAIRALYYNASCAFELNYDRSAKRVTLVYEKRADVDAASVFYGLCTKDGIRVCKTKSADSKVAEKKLYDTVKITSCEADGWLAVKDEGEGLYCEGADVRVCLSLTSVKTNAAIIWARDIANDNDFHYGHNDWAHHYGCYFCGTNSATGTKCSNGAKYEDQLKTYCCNPFVTAAYCHGAGAVKEGTKVDTVVNCKNANINLANDTNKALSNPRYWMAVPKPESPDDLLPGDVMLNPNHAMLYSGNGKLLEASGGDDNVKNSDRWNNSIHETSLSSSRWDGITKIYRYVGN